MDPYGKDELLRFYDRHLARFGDLPEALRWTSVGQHSRYLAILEAAGDLTGKDVLDFGCGKGDLYGFFRDSGRLVRYCGIDVNGNLIGLARRKNPEAEFLVHDIEEERLDRTFDVILICGVFNLRIAGIADSLRASLRKLMPMCRESLHLNVPSARAAYREVDMHYEEPEALLDFAREELSPSATLHDDLMEDELILSVHKKGI